MAKKRIIVFVLLALLLTALVLWIIVDNATLETPQYVINAEELPTEFSGYRIAQVSDLHNAQLGKDNKHLLEILLLLQPDIIAITGDLIDSRNTDISVALDFVAQAVKIAPCYYVSGNHEARISEYPLLVSQLQSLGVEVLEDQKITLTCNNNTITLVGVSDPSFETDYLFGDPETLMDTKLKELASQEDSYTILLSHRPELFSIYVENNVDLVLSGHTHGGQFRLPFVGGLFAPNQGFFPEYDAGLYIDGNTQMIVSRGLGNSLFPFRVNNSPEIILVELQSA